MLEVSHLASESYTFTKRQGWARNVFSSMMMQSEFQFDATPRLSAAL